MIIQQRNRLGRTSRDRGSFLFGAKSIYGVATSRSDGVIFDLPLSDAGAGTVNTLPVFAAGSYTATFTRATVAWTKLSTGLWASVATGVARSCYLGANTAVGAYGGYFAEAAGTQLVTPTASIRDMTDASWVAVTCTKAKTATGIDGAANSASTLTATGATATVLQTLVAAASSRAFSAFVRRDSFTLRGVDVIQDSLGKTFLWRCLANLQ